MKQRIINTGIFLAVISIISQLVSAIFSSQKVLSGTINFVLFGVMIWVIIHFIKAQRNEQDGLISFGEAFKMSFLSLLIGGLVGFVFTYIYNNFIDDSVMEAQVYETLKGTQEGIKQLSEEDQRQTLQTVEKWTRFVYTLPGVATLYVAFSILYALMSLIIAAILKRTELN
ncbi:MAG: DUF4199 domain-containing protein [Cryomorphaceae bacterium]